MQAIDVSLPVIGLSLGAWGALTGERVLRHLRGVLEVCVNPATETASVDYDPDALTVGELLKVIHDRAGDLARSGR